MKASSLVKGISETLTWQPQDKILNGSNKSDLFNNANWRKGFMAFCKFDLSFEATIYNNQIDELAKLAREHPNMNIMLSHMATPIAVAGEFGGIEKTKLERDTIFNAWRDSMSRLAENQNVHVKLSGLAMPICGFQCHKNQSAPSPTEVAKSFGPIINHAIDKVSLPLSTLIEAYQMIFENLADEHKRKIFYSNAMNFYKINTASI